MLQKTAITSKGPIEYRLEGAGPTVVVLNGGHCSRDTRLSHERLALHGYSVLTPSRPGYDSTPSGVGKTAQEAADALAGLLNELQVPIVDVIGISAAGPTALAFAQQHSSKLRKLVLESAVTTRWGDEIKILSRLGFGRVEKATWSLIKLALKIMPNMMIRAMVQQLTTLDVNEVLSRMNKDDLMFVRRMIETSRSGTGFLNDIEHHVDDLSGIVAPVLVMYSPNDKFVPEKNAVRVAAEVKRCELYEVPADTHLIWIGKAADDVWLKRLSFLKLQ
jgi:pimeloyl-ACP methyl ester carboxylesterase